MSLNDVCEHTVLELEMSSLPQDSLLDGEASQTHVHPRICASPVPSTPPGKREHIT